MKITNISTFSAEYSMGSGRALTGTNSKWIFWIGPPISDAGCISKNGQKNVKTCNFVFASGNLIFQNEFFGWFKSSTLQLFF